MITAIAGIAAALAALVAVYMSRPLFRKVEVSSARFLMDLPEPTAARRRWSPALPLRSLSFWLQVAVVGLLLAAALLEAWRVAGVGGARLGVWLLIDTSHSMTTRQGGGMRFDLARAAVERAIDRVSVQAAGEAPCFRLSSFDLRRVEWLGSGTADAARAAMAGLRPRAAGTDLSAAMGALSAPPPEGCPITHVVVVTDRPVPAVPADTDRSLVWIDVGQPVDNIGIDGLEVQRDPFTGAVREVVAAITAWGARPGDARAVVYGPDGRPVAERRAAWSPYGPWRVAFEPDRPGTYRIALSPSGAYDGDDAVELEVGTGNTLSVDWRLPDRRLPDRLGWPSNTGRPMLRVVGDPGQAGPEPTLVVGPGYRSGASRVDLFADRHPMLAGLNFDVLDDAGMSAARLPDGFRMVAADAARRVWIAAREAPRTAYIPGLPSAGRGPLDDASTLLFFNAVRWLLADQPVAVPGRWLSPDGTAIDAPSGEGYTGGEPRSHGTLDDLAPRPAGTAPEPVWPWLVLTAALLFAVERVHAAVRWRTA
ncbi:VWA domain-containing protein [Azospirillum brasilense]|uniref:VWA domain-containing protein n=1 Tax=Azospirillum brasilense TaxID=192 RepID=UPI0013B37BDB|nr:VWA domain-containing protein [Azospirillum brasilense]